MSEEEKPLEFSARDLMPDWAQEKAQNPAKDTLSRFADEGDRGPRDPRERRDSRGGRDRRGPGDSRGGGGDRHRSDRGRDDRSRGDGYRGDRSRGDGYRGDRPRGDSYRGERGTGQRSDRRHGDPRHGDSRRDHAPREDRPASGVAAVLEPSGPAIEGLTRHIRETFRSFPLADLAKMILGARERYRFRFTASEPVVLYQCQADGSLWLSREEAAAHLLTGPALETYYVAEDVVLDPPSGNYATIAVCGFSGTILGPPNHHEYQRNVARLHRERFADMSLERFKSRIRMESGEEILEKWKDTVSRVRHYRVKPAADASLAPAPEEAPPAPAGEESEVAAADPVGDATAGTAPTIESDSPAEAASDPVSETDAAPQAETEAAPEVEAASSDAAEESADETAEAPADPAPAATEGPLLKSIDEVARHFRQHFAAEAILETTEATVPGNIPGRLLSPGLLVLLRQEGDRLRRGFPLALVQSLCQAFEKQGLKFFKRGKKSLHVAAIRPRALDESVALTESIGRIIDYVKQTQKPTVAGLLEALVPGFQPAEPLVDESQEGSEAALAVLKDLRWLTAEGYVLEFPDTGLAMGRQPQSPTQAQAQTSADPGAAKQPKKKSKGDEKAKAVPAAAEPEAQPEAQPPAAVDSPVFDESETSPFPSDDAEAVSDDGDEPDPLPEDVNPVETF